MLTITIDNFADWRTIARKLVLDGVSPDQVQFAEDNGQQNLFCETDEAGDFDSKASKQARNKSDQAKPFRVPREFLSLAETVGYHRDESRWNLLYRTLWRIVNEQAQLLKITTDDDVLQLAKMEKEVRRDAHKMKAFVRFRKIIRDGEEYFIAWHRPDHNIVRKVAPFFSRRFKAMNWTILTPNESVVWNQNELVYGDGVPRSEAPSGDELEDLWKTYYAHIFNPARIKIKMMKSEMPVRHWPTLPETEIIADLLADAPRRVEKMIREHEGFSETALNVIENRTDLPQSLDELRAIAAGCTACDLHCHATQTVFGEGPTDARIVLVGEQPGDHEDNEGRPFIGPAGQIFNEALVAAGILRESVYVTNVVKHFKFTMSDVVGANSTDPTPRGKRRLHQRPNAREIRCCRPWFDAEWSFLSNAEVLVCLGATAAKAIISPNFRITASRGSFVESDYCPKTIATWHPSAILRSPDSTQRQTKLDQMIQDLTTAKVAAG